MKFKLFNYKRSLLLFVFLSVSIGNAQTYTSPTTLIAAVKLAGTTGGTFILKNGSYAGSKAGFTDLNPSAANPIIIKAETVGGVTLTGDSYFTFKRCSNITVEGFNIIATSSSTLVKLEGSNNMRITRNVFDLTTSVAIKWVYIGGVFDDTVFPYTNPSHHNRIDHNTFQNKHTAGHYITIDGNNAKDQSQYDQIDHNYFKDNNPRAVNEQESIRVGWSDMSKSSGFTTVEYNLFEGCDGDPEVLSVKSCDNIIRHNTFNGNYGTLSFRHGNRNRAEGNYFFGNNRPIGSVTNADLSVTKLYTGGIRVYGTDHVIVNNYFEGLNGTKWDAPITLTQGDAIEGNSTDLTKHYRIERLAVAYNTLVNNDQGIEIGFSNNGAYTQGIKNVTIANNLITGTLNAPVKIVDGKDQGSNVTWSNNLIYTNGGPVIEGGTLTTSFTTAQATNENPNLVFDNVQKTWRSTGTTPLYVNTTVITSNEDIDGQSRPSTSNPGADHFSMESVRYMPMTAATVGPTAYEDVPLALSPITSFAIGGESKITTVTTALAWTATVDNPSWLSINNASGTGNGSITITATPNTSGALRTGLLTVTGAGVSPVTLAITQVGPTLTLSAVANFIAGGEAKATTVTANVAWIASIDNPSWLSVNTTSGTNNGSINITAAANTLTVTRTGTLTVTGSGMTPATLTITQNGVPSGATLINTGTNGNPVSVTAINTQNATNIPENTLDKVIASRWADVGVVSTRGVLTYNLGSTYTMESIKIATTGSATKWYFYDIQFSTDGVNYTSAVSVESAKADQNTYATYPFTNAARFVKITGNGNNTSAFSNINEIEFWGTASTLSVSKNEPIVKLIVYPNPASTSINVQLTNSNCKQAFIYSTDGKLVLTKKVNNFESNQFTIDVSNLIKGNYILKLEDDAAKVINSKIISITK